MKITGIILALYISWNNKIKEEFIWQKDVHLEPIGF